MSVEFADFTEAEDELVIKIAMRAIALAKGMAFEACLPPPDIDPMGIIMDITATAFHTPLDLERMLEADNGDFLHDIMGIRANINRETGRLENCFLPRFAKSEHAT